MIDTTMVRSVTAAVAALSFAGSALAADDADLRRQAQALFGRIEGAAPGTTEAPQARLGRALFWDVRVSADGKTACASCHLAENWGGDRRTYSIDARNEATSRHSPTIF